jgi:hypothetical protein
MLFLASCSSIGFEKSNSSIFSEEQLSGDTPYGSIGVLKIYQKKKLHREIKVLCFINDTPDSFFDKPCKNISFELLRNNNEVIDAQQSDNQGRLRFNVKEHGEYRLRVNSKIYKTFSDRVVLSSGVSALVRLVKK